MAISSVSLSTVAAEASSQAQEQSAAARRSPVTAQQGNAVAAPEAQLSVQGRVNLALEDLQTQAQVLRDSGTRPEVQEAVQAFVAALNNLNQTVNAAPRTQEDARATTAVTAINKAVAGERDGELALLRQVGIERAPDNSFSVNLQRLDAGLREDPAASVNILDNLSVRVEAAAVRQLSGAGQPANTAAPAPAESDVTRRSEPVRNESQNDFRQRLAAQLTGADSYSARNAVATYFSISAL